MVLSSQALCRNWNVPYTCHKAIIDALSNNIPIFHMIGKMTLKFKDLSGF